GAAWVVQLLAAADERFLPGGGQVQPVGALGTYFGDDVPGMRPQVFPLLPRAGQPPDRHVPALNLGRVGVAMFGRAVKNLAGSRCQSEATNLAEGLQSMALVRRAFLWQRADAADRDRPRAHAGRL